MIGGGNIFRGVAPGAAGMDRATADYMGMLATVMNALALQDAMRQAGIASRVQSALNIEQVVEPYIRGKAIRYLEEGKVVIFAAGTGNPFFTTDTAAALRGTRDGRRDRAQGDQGRRRLHRRPEDATRARSATRGSASTRRSSSNLKVMDATALTLCRDQKLPINVFSIFKTGRAASAWSWARTRARWFTYDVTEVVMVDRRSEEDHRAEDGEERRGASRPTSARCAPAAPTPASSTTSRVDYYGTPTPINQVANVTLIDARTIGVTPFEKKMAGAIEKAIRDSDLGLNPATQGETVRVPMPALTEERRKELIKVVRHEAENARVAVRNLRRDAIHQLKDALKKHEVSEDDERRAQDEVQKMTDRHIAEIDKLLQEKEKELMAV